MTIFICCADSTALSGSQSICLKIYNVNYRNRAGDMIRRRSVGKKPVCLMLAKTWYCLVWTGAAWKIFGVLDRNRTC